MKSLFAVPPLLSLPAYTVSSRNLFDMEVCAEMIIHRLSHAMETVAASAALIHSQGHSKNPSGYGFDCVGAIFPEVFAGLGDGPAKASDQSDGGVP